MLHLPTEFVLVGSLTKMGIFYHLLDFLNMGWWSIAATPKPPLAWRIIEVSQEPAGHDLEQRRG